VNTQHDDPLTALSGSLLLQCFPQELATILPLCSRDGSGAILTMRQNAVNQVRMSAGYWRDKLGSHPLLIDANRYSGKNRKLASESLDVAWLKMQQQLGVPVVTDSGYIGPEDDDGLRKLFAQAADLADIVLVPTHTSLLAKPHRRELLMSLTARYSIPIALVLEHQGDPYGVQRVLKGFLDLLTCNVPVMPIRCDTSGLGALCFGAHAAGVGSRTSLRHLYPASEDSPKPPPPEPAAIIRECLSFRKMSSILFATLADPESSLWPCTCRVCCGRSVDWLARLRDPEMQSRLAFEHSAEVLLDLRDVLMTNDAVPGDRQKSWVRRCEDAQFRSMELEACESISWPPASFIGAWLANSPAHLRS
jgi:hypothetical protein